MWRPRDRERFIGSYDPEHEMPDPDRHAGERWQSDAYRHGARDTRLPYRFNPDMVEERYDGPRRNIDREIETRWDRDARDREIFEQGFRAGFEHGFDRGANRDFDRDRQYDRGGFMTGPRLDRDRGYGYGGSDHGYDRGFDEWDRGRTRRW